GKVVWSDGSSADGVYVTASDPEDWRRGFSDTRTDADGKFKVEGIPEVEYVVYVSTAEGTSKELNSINIDGIKLVASRKEPDSREYTAKVFVFDGGTGRAIDHSGVHIHDKSTERGAFQVTPTDGQPGTFEIASDRHFGNIIVKAIAP